MTDGLKSSVNFLYASVTAAIKPFSINTLKTGKEIQTCLQHLEVNRFNKLYIDRKVGLFR